MRLSDAEIDHALTGLPSWERSGDTLTRTIAFPQFIDGIRFVERIAQLAEEADHHPDIDIRYRVVRFVLSSHSEGGLTEKDVELAHQIDAALAR